MTSGDISVPHAARTSMEGSCLLNSPHWREIGALTILNSIMGRSAEFAEALSLAVRPDLNANRWKVWNRLLFSFEPNTDLSIFFLMRDNSAIFAVASLSFFVPRLSVTP